MEFLMTYGWAILVVLAAIGALAYFGMLSPDRFLPDKCVANPPLACSQYTVTGDAMSNVMIAVESGHDMNYTIDLTCMDGSGAIPEGDNTGSVMSGTIIAVNFTCPQMPAGTRWRGNFTVTYTNGSETGDYISTGSLAVTIE
jgi:hypothetical protein